MDNPKYEYYIYTWGGFYNDKYFKVHKHLPGARWFDTKESRDAYLELLKEIETTLNARHLAYQVAEGCHTRNLPVIHRISEYKGKRVYTRYEWSWPESLSALKYHAEWKWYPGFNDYPFGEDFDDYQNVNIVQEWFTGAFDNLEDEEE